MSKEGLTDSRAKERSKRAPRIIRKVIREILEAKERVKEQGITNLGGIGGSGSVSRPHSAGIPPVSGLR